MAIILMGSGQAEVLALALAALGGNPTGKYPCDMAPPGGRPRQEIEPGSDQVAWLDDEGGAI